jgi:hypothetical protein
VRLRYTPHPMASPSPSARGPAVLSVVVVALPVALALAVYAFALGGVRLGGDEPHYLIMADSLLTDRSLDLQRAYERDAETRAIFGPVTPHVIPVNERWMPYHTPGLSILISLPQWLAGERGVRLGLCLLAAALPWSLMVWLRRCVGLEQAAWVTIGVVVCTPTLFGATRVFPDLPAGIVATVCALWLIDRPGRNAAAPAWLAVGLASGFLAWLNVKYYGSAAVLFVALLAVGALEARNRRRRAALLAAAGGLCLAAVVAALLVFNRWTYGPWFGGRELREVGSSFSRAAEMLLGLHFDQSQGLFVRNPLLLAGVLLLPVFARRRPVAAGLWALLYGSLILPNALEMARYGGGAPAARFTWSAIWLWVVPIGVGLASLPRLRRFVPAAVIAALAYQAALAVRWLSAPGTLYPVLAEQLDRRDSLFPVGLRPLLPSFYFWDFSSYWTYGPNLAAYIITVLLLATGIALAMRRSPAAEPGQARTASREP